MDVTLKSGAKMVVSDAAYEDVDELMSAMAETGIGVQLSDDLLKMDVSVLKDLLFKAYASKRVKDSIFKCAESAVYEHARVTRSLFDDPKLAARARSDHFEILWQVVKVNVEPFFTRIFSALKERLKTSPSSPASPSQPPAQPS